MGTSERPIAQQFFREALFLSLILAIIYSIHYRLTEIEKQLDELKFTVQQTRAEVWKRS